MNISSAEFLAAVAIVTSAAVLQLREPIQRHDGIATSAPASGGTAPSSCDASGNGIIPASCEPARDPGPADHAPLPQHSAARIWV